MSGKCQHPGCNGHMRDPYSHNHGKQVTYTGVSTPAGRRAERNAEAMKIARRRGR